MKLVEVVQGPHVSDETRASGDTRQLPSPSVVEKYLKGEYGQKTGKGWYDYSKK